MPRAVIADELGPVENYSLRSFEPAALGPRDVRIAIRAAGVSFVDVLVAAGKYQTKPPVPFTPGSECAGVVTEVGRDVHGLSVGQCVIAGGWGGIFADTAVVADRVVRPMPETFSFEEASVFTVSFATVWHALVDRARLQKGETLLVLGAGGATGHAAVQVATYLQARVIASASSAARRALALAAGADAAVDARSPDWRAAVRAANSGRPIDVVFDPVGGEGTERAFRMLGWQGRHLVVGFPAGIASLPTNLPLLKGASLVGVNLGQFIIADSQRAHDNHTRVLALAAEGRFKPSIARIYPLARFAEAMTEVASGESAGRVVLKMD